VFHEPARRLLGLTNKAMHELHAKEGGAALKARLNQIDVNVKLTQLRGLVKTVTPSKLDDVVKQIKALEALKAAKLTPGDAYVLSKLPVLPPIMRPIVQGQSGGELVVGDSNYLYQNAMMHNQALQMQVAGRLLPPDEHATLRQNLFNAVGAVIGTNDSDNPKLQKRNVKGFVEHLTGKTTPKSSFFQKKIYKRQQDFSGRGTIAPDGSLGMDEVGIPEEMLWGMFSKFILTRLVRRGFPAVRANEMVEKRHPAARDALMAEIAERPVMVNRAPSLHRYNIVGAYAVPTPGKTIRVNPFIEKGMNADYDGDTFQVHTPALPAAVQEVKQMTLSNLLFGDRSKDDLMIAPTMEAVLGMHLATMAPKPGGKVHHYKTKADAMAAYHRGEITLQDHVEIK
jgi:DNA-directed RNA polymerase beta' subunit